MRLAIGANWGVAVALLFATACGLPRNEKSVTQCVIGNDQTSTINGKWDVTPVRIALGGVPGAVEDSGTRDDKLLIQASAEIWNRFSTISLGYPIIDYREPSGGVRLHSADLGDLSACNYDLISTEENAFVDPILIRKRAVWPSSFSSSVIAVTTACPRRQGCKGLGCIYKMSIIELNMQHYFSPGKPQPDPISILVHEMGHMLGLGHSCEYPPSSGSKIEGIPDCNSKFLPKSYRTAVMFPQFLVTSDGAGEVRSKLNGNDMGRTNCIYK
jgi:hypothetical protein